MSEIELVVLGLINEEPRHGYQIEALIEERGIREWTNIAFSSIYYVLKRLSDAALVTWELKEANRGSAKKVYRISKKGKQVLKESILKTLSSPDFSNMFLLGLANLPILSPKEATSALNCYKTKQEEKLKELKHKNEAMLPLHVKAMFSRSITIIEAELAWLSEFIEQILNHDSWRD